MVSYFKIQNILLQQTQMHKFAKLKTLLMLTNLLLSLHGTSGLPQQLHTSESIDVPWLDSESESLITALGQSLIYRETSDRWQNQQYFMAVTATLSDWKLYKECQSQTFMHLACQHFQQG